MSWIESSPSTALERRIPHFFAMVVVRIYYLRKTLASIDVSLAYIHRSYARIASSVFIIVIHCIILRYVDITLLLNQVFTHSHIRFGMGITGFVMN